jgi:hypothetical protein
MLTEFGGTVPHKNPEKLREWRSQWRISNPERNLLNSARHRATHLNLPFDLLLEDINIPERCPVLSIPIIVTRTRTDNTPSVDRKRPELGYVKGNVSVISWRANRIKSGASPEELMRIARWGKK